MKIITLMFILIFSRNSLSHGGGTKRSGPLKGCHNNRKTGKFHCHKKSRFNGMKWSSEEKAYQWLNSNLKSPSSHSKRHPGATSYKRSSFNHWIDSDGDCQNQRAEILIARSTKPVTYRKRKSRKKCVVDKGLWKDFYYPESHTLASNVDIDHVVPLKYAWDSGANKWSVKERENFANDPENLVSTSGVKQVLEVIYPTS